MMATPAVAGVLFAVTSFSALGDASPELGAEVFRRTCNACHAIACNKSQGPKLGGLFGRKAGTVADFSYSPEMMRSGIVWTERTLDLFVTDPSALVPGNRMASAPTVKEATERRSLIAWLKSEDTSLDICL
jgi:cytochrome c